LTDNHLIDDQDLLFRVSNSDQRAFEVLFRRYSSLLYSFLYEHIESRESAEDLVQEIFTQIWVTRESLAEIKRFGAFLFVLARNYAFNEIKKRIREKKRHQNWEETNYNYNYVDDPENYHHLQIQLNIVEQAIENLPEQQKRVWVLSRREGLKYTDIAQQMNLSRETIKKYIQHANTSMNEN
jgi:RNA polymerase sigma-70 factor (family 1)